MDNVIENMINNQDLLDVVNTKELVEIGSFIDAIRRWSKYNMFTTDVSPYLTDAKTVLEDEFAVDIMRYTKETGEFPVNMVDFMSSQRPEVQYLWNNSQKMRDLMTRITMRFIDNSDLGGDMDTLNKVFVELSRRIYRFMMSPGNPWTNRAINRGHETFRQ